VRRVVSAVVLVVLICNCSFRLRKKTQNEHERTDQTTKNEYVEEEIMIDMEERKEIGLFPEIEGFQEARFNFAGDGGYEVEMTTEDGLFLATNNDPYGPSILRYLLRNYEEIRENQASFERRWAILDYDTLGFPITEYEVQRIADPHRGVITGYAVGGLAAVLTTVAALFILPRAFVSTYDGSGYGDDIGPGVALVMLGVGASAALGMLAGCITSRVTQRAVSRGDRNAALNAIKEARKPRAVR
jgi:hypothetical protein